MKDYYEILGIDKNASKEEIRKAYKQLSFKYHPDKNNGNDQYADLFININEANQVLSNDSKREEYDAFKNLEQENITRKEVYEWYEKKRIKRKRTRMAGLTGGLAFIVFALVMIFTTDQNDKMFFPDKKVVAENVSPFTEDPETPALQSTAVEVKDTFLQQPPVAAKAELKQIYEELIQKEEVVKPILKKPAVITAKKLITKPATLPAKPLNAVASKELSEPEMNKILSEIYSKKRAGNQEIKCVRIIKTESSNLKNGFAIANFLQERGFTIAGRKVNKQKINGVRVDIVENCFLITLGVL